MAKLIEIRTRENRALAENTHEVDNLGNQVRQLNDKIRKLTG